MRKSPLVLALFALLGAAPASGAEWESFRGKEAPAFKIDKWINGAEGDSLEELRGKVILLEFWATW